jgi:glycosyltransferase involved in cell wall biosynthesis
MKLLYATSITLPSRHANRRQVLAQARAFSARLGDDFLLGIGANRDGADLGVPAIELGEGAKSPVLAWRYARLVRTRGITHVYVREERLFFFLYWYLRLLRPPARLYFEAHTLGHGFFFAHVVSHADGVVALTRGLREDLLARAPSARVLVAHDAVDLARFAVTASRAEARARFGLPQEGAVAAYVGRYATAAQDKGVDGFIRAVGKAREETLLHLFIVGLAEREVSAVERVCEASGIGAQVRTLVPYVPQVDVAIAMRAADLLVMNYGDTPHFARYMSPMKLFEYMTAGVPIITTDLPSVREVLSDDAAFFTVPGDDTSLAQVLVYVARHPGEAARRAASAARRVQGCTWDARASAILDFIARA